MENQHKFIDGYRDLSKDEIDAMNEIKRKGNELGNFLESLKERPEIAIDLRWLAIAQTDLQKGLMAAVRSVAKPTIF